MRGDCENGKEEKGRERERGEGREGRIEGEERGEWEGRRVY